MFLIIVFIILLLLLLINLLILLLILFIILIILLLILLSRMREVGRREVRPAGRGPNYLFRRPRRPRGGNTQLFRIPHYRRIQKLFDKKSRP